MRRGLSTLVLLATAGGASAQQFAPPDPAAVLATSDDLRTLERAQRVLIGRGSACLQAVEATLEGRRPGNRAAALAVLEFIRGPQVADFLIQTLEQDPPLEPSERVLALKALATQPTLKEVPPALLSAAASKTWSVRRAAALALGSVADPIAVLALEALVGDGDPDVRAAAVASLMRSPAPTGSALMHLYPSLGLADRERALDVLFHSPAPVDPNFLAERPGKDDPTLAIRTLALRARGGEDVLARKDARFIVQCAATARSDLRDPAQFILTRDRERAAVAVAAELENTVDDVEAAALGDALVELIGPAARSTLLDVARRAGGPARAGAIKALLRFRSPRTSVDLAWIFAPELPRVARDALVSAFEEFAGTPGGRSGLLAALEDQDAALRMRAFSALVKNGVLASELPLLSDRVRRETGGDQRQRMARLLVSKAKDDTAWRLAYPLVNLLTVKEPARSEARDALENLKDRELRREVARLVLDRLSAPWRIEDLRLLTRLAGPEADAVIAHELSGAVTRGETVFVKDVLIQLRTGGGTAAVAAARPIARSGDAALAKEALKTLLLRADVEAPAILTESFPTLSAVERAELIALLTVEDPAAFAPTFGGWLEQEQDPEVRLALVERAGEIAVPVSVALTRFLDAGHPVELRAATVEALAALADDSARAAVRASFDSAVADLERLGSGFDDDARLMLLTTARGVAAQGDEARAQRLAALLFAHVPELERRLLDVEGGFDFEETIADALVHLARSTAAARTVAAAVEVEIERRAVGGDLFLMPKALLLRLGRRFQSADAAFRPVAQELYETGLRLPPRGLEYEPLAAVRAAEYAAAEHDSARAADHLETALRCVERASPQDLRVLREELGMSTLFIGYEPVTRLRGELELARAAAARQRGADGDARRSCLAALAAAPHDAEFRLRVAAFLLTDDFDRDAGIAEAFLATALAPFHPELLDGAARLIRAAGQTAEADALDARLASLRECGLAPAP